MNIKSFYLSTVSVYLSGLLVALGMILQKCPMIIVSEAFIQKNASLELIGGFILSFGFFLMGAHFAANEHVGGKTFYRLVGMICLVQSLVQCF
jgi:hypothetical protein